MKPDKVYEGRSTIRMYNRDCMELLNSGNNWNLAIIDPPYGIEDKISIGGGSHTKTKTKFHNLYSENGKKWDIRPPREYFIELQRVSKNQIVCGGNYFTEFLPVSRGWAYWHKQGENMSSVNDELIWTSLDISIKMFSRCHGLDKGFMNKEGKNIHPTQKPIQLYKWLLTNYAKQGDTILDTHGGSLSIAIACWDLGFDLDVCELDKDYFDAAVKRFENHIKQTQLF